MKQSLGATTLLFPTPVLSEDGLPDILKIKPLVFDTAHKGYHSVGSLLGKAFSIGKKLL